MPLFLRVSVAVLLLTVLVGCASKRSRYGVVAGKITYKGDPVNDAALVLYPAEGPATNPIVIPVDAQGTFRITDVPPGEYKVVVQGTAGGPKGFTLEDFAPDKREQVKPLLEAQKFTTTIPFPEKYKALETTDLKCTIGDNDQPMDLVLED
jgi:hypothetical protein